MRHIKQIVLTILFLLIAGICRAEDELTYTRTVKVDTWESFCLPMNVDIDELQIYFDKIYIAKTGDEIYDIYDDLDDVIPGDEDEELVKGEGRSNLVVRRATESSLSITCTAEPYSEEEAYWTDEEEEGHETVRCCFTYSAPGNRYYHFFIADFLEETGVVIPQGTPFFAHVRSDAELEEDNTLTLNGYLWDDETGKTGIIDKPFNVYSNQTLETIDSQKSLDAVGKLSDDEGFTASGTLYAINLDGSFSKTETMVDNHAYLMVGADDAEIILYSKPEAELETLTEINIELHLTDAAPTLIPDTYRAGDVTYTRTGSYIIDGNYSSFCLPFDFNVADALCFNKIYVPIHIAFYNTDTEKLKIFLVNQTDMVEAGTPFVARLTGEPIELTSANKVTYGATASNPDERELTVFNNSDSGLTSVLTSNETIKLWWGGTLISTPAKEGMNTFNLNGSFGPRTSTSNLSPFRAYLIETNIDSSVKASDIEVSLGDDETTGIEQFMLLDNDRVDVYSINGILLRKHVDAAKALEGLHSGLYIVNGNKVFKE